MLSTEKIMLTGELGRPFKLAVDKSAEILRCGIDPATAQPAVWILFDKDHFEGPEFRHMLVVTTGMDVPVGATHRGMWWAAAETFHLFELERDPALLTSILGDGEKVPSIEPQLPPDAVGAGDDEESLYADLYRNNTPGLDT